MIPPTKVNPSFLQPTDIYTYLTNMDREQIMKIATLMSAELNGMPPAATYSVAREAIRGMGVAGDPTDRAKIEKAAFKGIKKYYMIWGDAFIQRLAGYFTDAYHETIEIQK